jgi:hypothetical protein
LLLGIGNKDKRGYLTDIFDILDNLILVEEIKIEKEGREKLDNIIVKIIHPPIIQVEDKKKEFSESKPFPLTKFIADFFRKTTTFVRSLKRELIYAQSEGIIR